MGGLLERPGWDPQERLLEGHKADDLLATPGLQEMRRNSLSSDFPSPGGPSRVESKFGKPPAPI